ncbi:MAG: 5'/3'-nucleotidase SurE [Bacillota bacterium]
MNILITNDDGIFAEGIQTLASTLADSGHNLVVVAPDRERSASGHAITITSPLRIKRMDVVQGVDCYQINGTPADCVKLGIDELVEIQPDLILSGINHGPNLGLDVLYSGTVSAAIEGWMMGMDSIAVSLALEGEGNFLSAADFIDQFLGRGILNQFSDRVLLNINVPDLKPKKMTGTAITDTSYMQYDDFYQKRRDPMGNDYYWLDGDIVDNFEEGSDIWAIHNNQISISPLKIDLINDSHKQLLQKIIIDE